MIILLYIVIVIMAFVFGITISNTIRREAGVIGTLRASGYTRRELIRHYMALPVLVTLVGAPVSYTHLDVYKRQAWAFLEIQKEYGSFSGYIWHWTDGKVVCETGRTSSELSDCISKDLKKRGMKFVGTTVILSLIHI